MPQETPFLIGKRLSLHVLSMEDAPRMLAWINDPEVRQFIQSRLPVTEEGQREWVRKSITKMDPDMVFGIVAKEGRRHIGNIALHQINWRDRTATTGSLIGEKDFWGKGYGPEAKMILLDYAFNTLGLRKINSRVYATNPRSHRALLKCGYREEGVLRAQVLIHGVFVNVIEMAVFRDEWLPLWEEFRKRQ